MEMESLIKTMPHLFYIDAVWIGIVSVAGVIGNMLALCAVATTPSLRTATQLHITILAGVDLFITAVLAPCRLATEYYASPWHRNYHLCYLFAFAAMYFIGFSLQQLMHLAFNRFIRITQSETVYRKVTSKPVVIGLQAFSVLITFILTCLPFYSGLGTIGYHPKSHFCLITGPSQKVLAGAAMTLALVLTPMYYALTFYYVRAHRRKVQNWRSGNTERTMRRENVDLQLRRGNSTSTEQRGQMIFEITSNTQLNTTEVGGTSLIHHQDPNTGYASQPRSINLDTSNTMNVKSSQAPGKGSRRSKPDHAGDVPKNGPTKENIRLTRNLLLIFCAYMSCWLPWCLLSFVPIDGIPTSVIHVVNNLVLTNSCINPYLYACMSRNYRKAFKKCVLICFCKRRPN